MRLLEAYYIGDLKSVKNTAFCDLKSVNIAFCDTR